MIAITYYLLKVFICSAVLFLYYHLSLRNKIFHQWNRYYLLATVLLSLLIPCFKFAIFSTTESAKPIELLQVVYTADEYVAKASQKNYFSLSLEQTYYLLYTAVSLTLFVLFLISVFKIRKLVRSHAIQRLNRINFINTEVKGTPFSFFHFIFWNRSIDIHSDTGQQIFQHELVHVKEKHTIDKIFLQIVLSVFWYNPIFWLVRNELRMIHEFIADKKAVGQADTSAFAAMILQAAYPQHSFNNLTNQFFQSSIKRRLFMLTKQKNSKISYASRILALPVIALLLFAFTIKKKSFSSTNIALDKTITVVIDPGHGGSTGARFGNIYEDELVLQLAKQIKEANLNDKVKLVFTRESATNVDLKERVNIAQKNNADLFISLHMNASDEANAAQNKTGIEVLVAGKSTSYKTQSELLGSSILDELKSVYNTSNDFKLRSTGIWVLDHNICPAVIVECGNVSNEKDRAFMSSSANQKLMARQLLTAIERYAAQSKVSRVESSHFAPNVITKAQSVSFSNQPTKTDTSNNPLVYIDGVKKGKLNELGGLDKLVPVNEIKAMYVYKGKEALDKYGKEGADGVIELLTKNAPPPPPPPVPAKPKKAISASPLTKVVEVKPDVAVTLKAEHVQVSPAVTTAVTVEPLVIIDGKEIGKIKTTEIEKKVKPNTIKVVSVYKGKDAVEKYGDKGIDGVIEVTTDKQN